METDQKQPWNWTEPQWRGYVEKVRAGASLAPSEWPDHAAVSVALSFGADQETIPLQGGHISPGWLSEGEYGSRVGSRRLLNLLDEFGAPATFFMPAVAALLHPDEVRAYVEAGHEIGCIGWIHERASLLEPGEEAVLTARSLDTLEKLTGDRPVGMRTPSWDFSPDTLSIMQANDIMYDSSMMADDDPYELLSSGKPTGIVEIPVDWIRDDAMYFMMDRTRPIRPYTSPESVLEIWKREFDDAYAEHGVFQLTMHPHIIGHRSRAAVLRELLRYIASHSGVWFARHKDVANYVRKRAHN